MIIMKNPLQAILFICLFFLGCEVHARIYQTSDAIIVEVEDLGEGRDGRSVENDIDTKLAGDEARPNRVLPGGTFLLTERSCWTPEGHFGTCASLRSCYPDIQLSSKNALDLWIIGARGTCVFSDQDGKQIFGVCCAARQKPSPVGGNSNPGFPFVPGFPWWPHMPIVPLPASSGNPRPPTTTRRPTTTSPWWVPEKPSTTTTRRPTTTSPWWVPEKPSTTTTRRPTTTSPWWVPEKPSTTTTRRPTTTSPWWVPENPSTATPARPSTTRPSVMVTRPETTASTTKPTTTTTQRPTTAWTTQRTTTPRTTTTTKTTTTTSERPPTNLLTDDKVACGAGPFKTLSVDEQERIVGGTTATKNAWRFLVALFNNNRHFCGGSLLDSTHVLTAAHCVAHMSSTDVSRLQIALGMHTLRPVDMQAVRKKVRRVIRHKGFNAVTLYNDVAILTLDSPVTFNSAVSPVCLPPLGTTDDFTGKEAVVVGWGALKEGGRQPDVLQQVTVQIQSNQQCKKNYGNDAPGGIADHMICAAYPGKDSCSGDSGGPMIIQQAPGSPWVQAGIVSWGIGCGKAPYPGVYSRVTSFMDWITKNSNN